MNQQAEVIEEVAAIDARTEAQTISVDCGATPQEEDYEGAKEEAKEEAKRLIDEFGSAGFVLFTIQDNGKASVMLAGDYPIVARSAHTIVCALGDVVKQLDGGKLRAASDFEAGAVALISYDKMVAKMDSAVGNADQVAEATVEAAASTKQ